jgi:branched-chain amino acid transport system permease protein
MEYLLHLLIFISIYTILSQSLSLTAGYSGLISIAHAAFYGIGAYTTAILAVNYGFSFLLTLPLAILVCGITALIVAIVSIRTVDDYFIVITLGIQVVVFSIMNNWQEFTRGPLGIPGIPPINILGLSIDNHLSFFALSLFFMGLIWFLLNNITRSPFGKILIALSEDEIFTKSLGKNVNKAKVISFAISAMFASVAGVLYAHYISYIDPTSFTIDESIFILSIVIIGGMRDLKRITMVAAFLILLPEVLRFVGMPNSIAANVRQMVYGTCLILFMFKNTDKLQT